MAPALKPVLEFFSWIWAPSIGAPLASVTVPVTAPVVTPWARRRAEAPVTSAKAVATVQNRRVLSMLSLEKMVEGSQKVARRSRVRQENLVTLRQRLSTLAVS